MNSIYWIGAISCAKQAMIEQGRCPILVQKAEWLMAGKDICNGKLTKLSNNSIDTYRCTQCGTRYEEETRRK